MAHAGRDTFFGGWSDECGVAVISNKSVSLDVLASIVSLEEAAWGRS